MSNRIISALTYFLIACAILFQIPGIAQKTCTSNPTTISSNINFTSISWTASGGATVTECNNMATGTSFMGNVVVDLANNRTITISNDVTIDGDFNISGGNGSTLSVSGGGTLTTLYVTGDLGDAANNGVQYSVPLITDQIIVDGTLFGKNNNAFTGSGSISGGTLNVKNGATCGSPCPVSGGFSNCTAGDTFCDDNSVLPVVLLYLDYSIKDETVILKWATVTEENNDFFYIERSVDGINYSYIGEVKGAGTSTALIEYEFKDRNPLFGVSYYRLTQVDFDWASETFTPLRLEYYTLNTKSINIFPNPIDTSTKLYINSSVDPDEQLTLTIENSIGQVLQESSISGSTLYEISLDNTLKTGYYLMRFKSATRQISLRLIIE